MKPSLTSLAELDLVLDYLREQGEPPDRLLPGFVVVTERGGYEIGRYPATGPLRIHVNVGLMPVIAESLLGHLNEKKRLRR